MGKHPAEVFGHPIQVRSRRASKDRMRHWCPFLNRTCSKRSRLIDYPMGVCSVQFGDDVVALCPDRFLESSTVFQEIADHHFLTRDNLLVFPEVGIRRVGTFDYVMVKHKPLSDAIEDFIVIEFQTAQTTGTGGLVQALRDFVDGEQVREKNYRFGLNMADIWKRSFTQILNKGIVTENWGNRIFWVVQEVVYRDLVSRYSLVNMGHDPQDNIVFVVCDLRLAQSKYRLSLTRIESSNVDDLFDAFRNRSVIPSKDAFVDRLRQRIKAKMSLKLSFDKRSEESPGRTKSHRM